MNPTEPLYLTLPAGRIISGSLSDIRKVDHAGRPTPEDKWTYNFGVAISKTDPSINGILGQIMQHAMAAYQSNPAVTQVIQQGLGGSFKWKISDGDDANVKNKHAAGCFVFWFAQSATLGPIDSYAVGMLVQQPNIPNVQVDPATIKRGFYVDVAISVKPNGLTDGNAGIYINPTKVRLVGYGELITAGPSADQVFGSNPVALPAGASATPVAPGGGMPASAPPVPGMAPTAPPVPGMAPTAPPVPGMAPTAPPVPGMAPTAPPVPGMAPTALPVPGMAPTAPPVPGMAPTAPPVPGMAPTALPVPGMAPTAPPVPGMAPTAPPVPGMAPAVNPTSGAFPVPTGMPGVAPVAQGGGMPSINQMSAGLPAGSTASPIDPMTGQPVQPHPGILGQ